MSRLARWQCPKCGEGQLAPRRARRNDSRTYCFGCSGFTGRLVRRVCPVVEKARAERAVARNVERQSDRERAQALAQAWPNCLQEEWSRMLKLPTAREYMHGRMSSTLQVLNRKPIRRLGTAYGGRVTIRVGGMSPDSIMPRATMLHELAHEMLLARFGTHRPQGRRVVHGSYFHAALKAITEEYTGIQVVLLDGTQRVENQAVTQAACAARAVAQFLHLAAQSAAEAGSNRAAEAQGE